MTPENEAYARYIKHEIIIDSLIVIAVIVAVYTTERLYPLWILLLLGARTMRRFLDDHEKV